MRQFPNLTPRQSKAVSLLLAGRSVATTAHEVGVARQTLSRWLNQDGECKDTYEAARREAGEKSVSVAVANLQRSAIVASETLERIMKSRRAAPSAQVAACRVVLDAVDRFRLDDLETRLTELEARLEAS